MEAAAIPGYAYGAPELAPSPVTLDDLDLLKQTVLFTEEDERNLRLAGEVLADQIDAVLDLWYGYVASHPHLVRYFAGSDGAPIGEYLERVRARFSQWVRDACSRPYDQTWLDYQNEIALRHTAAKKNRVDGVDAAPEIPLRYMIAFVFPITATMRAFLANKGHTAEEVDAMHSAWFKAVTLHVTLWAHPYSPQRW